ncbi:hypothetical protein MARILYN_25 [Vibrio phage Marilyn]|nr:hypothetical protein MARILYN_25 [Vibrio phage Marilyn]WCD55548.1 hypothetical protein FAYDEN_25 [Vibrio phage Fayden]WCD55605.1 hypothetical protein BAYBAE_25 [Vibrio phage Baybae]WCD55664.1 hypothetical protein VAITEPHAGE_25 [Vibrio phage Vaitephage]
MNNQPAKALYSYTPAQPYQIRHFDYSNLAKSEIFMLMSAAVVSKHLTHGQRERLINIQLSH